MPPNPLAAHQERLERWAEDELGPYIKRLERHRYPYETAKEFNDPVWGTLQLRPYEVVVLDSPLLQRLRRIRQLGVVHFVYPAATHTRLEHSLGVLHQVQRLVTSINEHGLPVKADGRIDQPISERQERILRLAGLCHDIGHGAMSHVSEYSIEESRECHDVRLQFQRLHERPSLNQLSEIAAYYILGSPAFEEMLEHVHRLCPPPSQIPDLPRKLQSIVIGKSIDMDVLLLHELISGPFDADKLDYLARDALMCGVPNVADVPRLIQKVRAVRVDRSRLPKNLKKLAADQQDAYVVTGVARSGARTLDEVALARTLMFDKIYRHHKVRAAEAMVFSLFELLKKIWSEHPAMLPFALTDEEVLSLTESGLVALAGRPLKGMTAEQQAAVTASEYISRRLRDRRLFTRGFAFAARMPRDAFRHDPAHAEGLERFLSDCSTGEGRSRVSREIVRRMREICDLLDKADLMIVPGGDVEPFISISPPKPPPKMSSVDAGHAYLIDENGVLLQADEEAGEASGLADAAIATRDLGYIFSLRRLSPIVYLASEAFIREEYQVRIPETMLAYAKQNREVLNAYRVKLDEAGWYDSKPMDIRPMPAVLTRADAHDRADEIVERLRGYSGPWQLPRPGVERPTSTVSRQQVLSFVRQFGDDDLVDAALTMLSRIRVVGREDANQALKAFLEQNPDFSPGSYCALGEFRDSSALLTYYVGDVAHDNKLVQRTLTEALTHESPIIFVDDLVGRGSQSISIIENWLGVEPTQNLNERRTQTLNRLQVEAFRQQRLAFVFVAGLDEGVRELRRAIERLGLNAKVYVNVPEAALPFMDSVLGGHAAAEKMRQVCEDIGRRLLMSPDRLDEWVQSRCLGYGNRGLLLASTYNTPSATLTCLWKEGNGDFEWTPLLPRRKKL
ncbi:HD domain-containing protein [Micromonospora chalcea]